MIADVLNRYSISCYVQKIHHQNAKGFWKEY